MSLMDYVKARVVEEGDCWIWQQSCRSFPVMNNAEFGVNGSVRRAMWKHINGLSASKNTYVNTKCNDKRCVNPDHLRAQKVSTAHKSKVARSVTHSKSLAKVQRSKSVLNETIVREIRAAEGKHDDIGARFGVSGSHVSKIKAGKAWKEYGNPFAGLIR